MFVARNVEADHKDLIHDVAYDFYGRRLATCSSDQSVKVWDLGEDGQWHCTASWKCHQASVWKVTWAHPEFGQVLATCSFDRSAGIWEELPADSLSGESNQSHWVRRAFLVDSRTSVTDVKFAPRHLGLLLATCSADGSLRIYEAPDVMTLSQWSVQHEINCKISLSSITWNPSRIHPPMIAVGSDDTSAGGKVIIFEFSENTRQWIKIEVISLVSDPVHDIAFAPNVGRSYHLLGIASRDVKILSIKPFDGQSTNLNQQSHSTNNANQLTPNQKFEIKQVAQFNEHGAQVWRVSWNITGTILASSGDDGSVRLWKANYLDNWKCVTELKCQNNQAFLGVSSSHDDNRSGGSDGKNPKGHRNFSSLVSPGPMTRH